jgi:hypothetical protein
MSQPNPDDPPPLPDPGGPNENPSVLLERFASVLGEQLRPLIREIPLVADPDAVQQLVAEFVNSLIYSFGISRDFESVEFRRVYFKLIAVVYEALAEDEGRRSG